MNSHNYHEMTALTGIQNGRHTTTNGKVPLAAGKSKNPLLIFPQPYGRNATPETLGDFFVETTTMHALPHVCNPKLNCCRVIWLFILFVVTGFLGYHASVLIQRYFNYPFQVTISIQHADALEFPAVTVCNLNPIASSKLAQGWWWKGAIGLESRFNCIRIRQLNDSRPEDDLSWMDAKTRAMFDANLAECIKADPSAPSATTTTAKPDCSQYDDSGECLEPDDDREDYNFLFTGIKIDDGKKEYDPVHTFERMNMERDARGMNQLVDTMRFALNEMDELNVVNSTVIYQCSFDRSKCDNDTISTLIDEKYGKCETFNSVIGQRISHENGTGSGVLTRMSGAQTGLRLTIDVHTKDYVGLLAKDYGARIVIHPPDVMPDAAAEGFNISPGRKTSISLRETRVDRLRYPYKSDCLNHDGYHRKILEENPEPQSDSFHENVVNTAGVAYTFTSCQASCVQYHLIRECNCFDEKALYIPRHQTVIWKHNTTLPFNGTDELNYCDFSNPEISTCRAKVMKRLGSNNPKYDFLNCSLCRNPCQETLFKRTLSTSRWPTANNALVQIHALFGKDYVTKKLQGDYQQYWEADHKGQFAYHTYASENLIRLHVYMETLNFEHITEEPSYPFTNLLADLGGVLGLYLGLSVTTLFEVVQILWFYITHRCCGHKRPVTGEA